MNECGHGQPYALMVVVVVVKAKAGVGVIRRTRY